MGRRAFFSGEQGNKGIQIRRTREQRQYSETGNIGIKNLISGNREHRNQDFDVEKQGNKAIYSGTREQVPSKEDLAAPVAGTAA